MGGLAHSDRSQILLTRAGASLRFIHRTGRSCINQWGAQAESVCIDFEIQINANVFHLGTIKMTILVLMSDTPGLCHWKQFKFDTLHGHFEAETDIIFDPTVYGFVYHAGDSWLSSNSTDAYSVMLKHFSTTGRRSQQCPASESGSRLVKVRAVSIISGTELMILCEASIRTGETLMSPRSRTWMKTESGVPLYRQSSYFRVYGASGMLLSLLVLVLHNAEYLCLGVSFLLTTIRSSLRTTQHQQQCQLVPQSASQHFLHRSTTSAPLALLAALYPMPSDMARPVPSRPRIRKADPIHPAPEILAASPLAQVSGRTRCAH